MLRLGPVRSLSCGLLLLLASAPAAIAQNAPPPKRDESQLIQTLAQYGMTELLEHLRQTGGVEGVEAELAAIGQHRIDLGDANLPVDKKVAALTAAMKGYENLVTSEALKNHPQRPIWMTELAEMLLMDAMNRFNDPAKPQILAPSFAEFGVPTEAQREAMQGYVPRALELAQAADDALFRLRGELAANDRLRNELEASGTLARLNTEFGEIRTPYVLALAQYQSSLMEGGDVLKPGEAAGEAKRLRGEAAARLSKVIENATDVPTYYGKARALRGRVLMSLGETQKAIEELTAAVEAVPADPQAPGGQPLENLLAELGRAFALQQSQGLSASYEVLRGLEAHPLAGYPWPYGLLLADAKFRVMMADAQKQSGDAQTQAISAAYNEYTRFLDTVEDAGVKGWLKTVIANRQVGSAGDDLNALPQTVRADLAEKLLNEGIGLAKQEATRAEGKSKLEESIKLNQELVDGPATPGSLQARAMYNIAQARFALDDTDVQNLIEVAKLLRLTAETHPDSPNAEKAIGQAANIFAYLNGQKNKRADVRDEYEATVKLLFAQFRNTPVAYDQVVTYAREFLQPEQKWREAADLYNIVQPSHDDYFLAEQDRLDVLLEDLRSRSQNSRAGVARELEAAIGDVEQVAAVELEALEPGQEMTRRQKQALDAAATATLTKAGLAAESNQPAEALTVLANFPQRFALATESLRDRASQLLIRSAIAAGSDQVALQEAQRLMAASPDAAETVVSRLLDDFEKEIDRLQGLALTAPSPNIAKTYQQEASKIAATSVQLAQLLLERAVDEGKTGKELLGYQLPLAKALRLSGQPAVALKMLEPLLADETLKADGRLQFQAAESHFDLGTTGVFPDYKVRDAASLQAAKDQYARLIAGIQQSGPPPYGEPFDDIYWRSLLHVLAAEGLLGNGGTIGPTVKQLRLQSDNLGGLTMQFEELVQKNHRGAQRAIQTPAPAAAVSGGEGPQLAAGDRLQKPSQTWLFVLIGVGVVLALLVAAVIYLVTKPRKKRPRPSQQGR